MIPIQNLYYVLCYAWNRLDEGELAAVPIDEAATPQDLLGHVLLNGARRILKDGLDRGYVSHYEETGRLRGRIDFCRSVGRALLPNAKAGVHFDELSHDVLHNQILKSTMLLLAATPGLDKGLAKDIASVARRFEGVSVVGLELARFKRLQLHRNNAFYTFLMNVCELVVSMILPGEGGGESRFRDFVRDEERMHAVFQDFVYNFLRLEQSDFVVRAQSISWEGHANDAESARFLPGMITDITLESSKRKIIIDTKYYSEAFQENFGKKSVRSGHLYQIFAYVENAKPPAGPNAMPIEGCLLYPAVAEEFDLGYLLHGHPIRVMAVDLRQPWTLISKRLKTLLEIPSLAAA